MKAALDLFLLVSGIGPVGRSYIQELAFRVHKRKNFLADGII